MRRCAWSARWRSSRARSGRLAVPAAADCSRFVSTPGGGDGGGAPSKLRSTQAPRITGEVRFGAEVAAGLGQSHAISVGSEVIFGGSVPPIPDDPATPEDEYKARAFSFVPAVYRETYQDADGTDSHYYVLTFATGVP